jgi:hypothetical protein
MNITLWVFQILLALHTAMGAIWKFSKSPEETMPSLAAIPQSIWISLSIVELIVAVCLVVPALNKGLGIVVPIAAIVIAVEMLAYCGIHFLSGAKDFGPVSYWVVVALICTFVAFGRLVLRPF